MDAQSISILIVAVCAGLVTLTSGIVMPILIFIRQSKADAAIAGVQSDVTKTHDLVNSKMEEQKVLIERLAFAAGKKEGVAEERANPLTPTVAVPEAEKR